MSAISFCSGTLHFEDVYLLKTQRFKHYEKINSTNSKTILALNLGAERIPDHYKMILAANETLFCIKRNKMTKIIQQHNAF